MKRAPFPRRSHKAIEISLGDASIASAPKFDTVHVEHVRGEWCVSKGRVAFREQHILHIEVMMACAARRKLTDQFCRGVERGSTFRFVGAGKDGTEIDTLQYLA
jgi:hypothetical protein